MTSQKTQTRSFTMELELDQSPDVVWRALSSADELTRWFPLDASVEPHPGGRVLLSWPMEGCAFDTTIGAWAPGRHLKLVENKEHEGKPVSLAMDFHLSPASSGQGTVLRLVHSGFGNDQSWDGEFSGITRGWTFELRALQHYLEHHLGRDRRMAMITVPTDLPPEDVYTRLFSDRGIMKSGRLGQRDEPFTLQTCDDQSLSGTVITNDPPNDFAGTIPEWNQAILRYCHEGSWVMLVLETWDDTDQRIRQFDDQWRSRLQTICNPQSSSD